MEERWESPPLGGGFLYRSSFGPSSNIVAHSYVSVCMFKCNKGYCLPLLDFCLQIRCRALPITISRFLSISVPTSKPVLRYHTYSYKYTYSFAIIILKVEILHRFMVATGIYFTVYFVVLQNIGTAASKKVYFKFKNKS